MPATAARPGGPASGKALVFGANGQDGAHLIPQLRALGVETLGVSRSGDWVHADVASFADVERLVREVQPDYVFQLAAASTTRHDALFENHGTISTGALNVLESVWRHRRQARVFIPGSAVQFENRGVPADEATPFAATSPYAVARIQSVYAARYYRSLGLRTYVGYLFHHESPRRAPRHVSRMIALAALRAARGTGDAPGGRITIGDPRVVKEWTFAGDVTRAMLALVSQEQAAGDEITEVVIGSGEGHSIEEWLECCFAHVGLRWRDHVDVSRDFRAEYARLVSNPARIRSLGWRPEVSFEELANTMMKAESEAAE